jgi:hypothetical protein
MSSPIHRPAALDSNCNPVKRHHEKYSCRDPSLDNGCARRAYARNCQASWKSAGAGKATGLTGSMRGVCWRKPRHSWTRRKRSDVNRAGGERSSPAPTSFQRNHEEPIRLRENRSKSGKCSHEHFFPQLDPAPLDSAIALSYLLGQVALGPSGKPA